MNSGLSYAIACAFCFGFWTVLHAAASKHISGALGAILVSLSAALLGAFFVIPQLYKGSFSFSTRGLFFVVLAGICAFAIDFFALKAYETGLPISIGGPIIIGGSMAIASLVGICFLGETLSLMKLISILMILFGAALLAREG